MSGFKVSKSKSKFKANAFGLFRNAEESVQSILVGDHGKPTVEVGSYCGDKRSPLDVLRGSVIRYDAPTDPIDVANWSSKR